MGDSVLRAFDLTEYTMCGVPEKIAPHMARQGQLSMDAADRKGTLVVG